MNLLFVFIATVRQRLFIQKFKSLNIYMQMCRDHLELNHVKGSSVKFCGAYSNFNFYPPHPHVEWTLPHRPTSALIISIIFDLLAPGIIVSTPVSEKFVKSLQITTYKVKLVLTLETVLACHVIVKKTNALHIKLENNFHSHFYDGPGFLSNFLPIHQGNMLIKATSFQGIIQVIIYKRNSTKFSYDSFLKGFLFHSCNCHLFH